jgi:putative ABC transport system substrate-binding protein
MEAAEARPLTPSPHRHQRVSRWASLALAILMPAILMLTALGLLVACSRLPALGLAPRNARIGFLGNSADRTVFTEGFRQGLDELGYVEGQNVFVEWRFADGSDQRLAELAAELVALQPDVLVGAGTQACLALKQATTTIPIVMGNSSDPVGVGLVASLARPGGNVTGTSAIGPKLVQKRLEKLRQVRPQMDRLAVVWNPADPPRWNEFLQIHSAAKALNLQLLSLPVSDRNDFAGAIRQATAWPAEAMLVLEDPLTHSNIGYLVAMIVQAGLPSAHSTRPYVEAGGLLSYGADLVDVYRRSATYVDKILKGARPADLPVEEPTNFEFVVNLKTARQLGLAIPETVLHEATDVIQEVIQ